MSYYGTCEPIPVDTEKRNEESVKDILKNTDCLLNEARSVLGLIEGAVFGPSVQKDERPETVSADISLLMTMRRQRSAVEDILNTAMRIKEGLWSDV